MSIRKSLTTTLLLASVVALCACDSEQAITTNSENNPLPEVSVAAVVQEKISDWTEFNGRLEAPQTVALRPRVSGYIESVLFEEGAMVKAGDPLFFIDDRAVRAEVRRLQAELKQAQSAADLAESEYQRAQALVQQAAISKEQLDVRRSAATQTKASVNSVRSALKLATLQRSFTRVEAPISGRVSRANITRGNYVFAGETVLTTIVSTDEIFAYFDADEQTYLDHLQPNRRQEKVANAAVLMGLANESAFPHEGTIDFLDNQLNPATGTIRARAVFPNEDGAFLPGLYARIRISGAGSYKGVLIDDRAIGTDLNNKFVYVVNGTQQVEYRPVHLGNRMAGLRVIKSGLFGNERIIVSGLQRVRPGDKVNPTLVPMTQKENIQALQAMQHKVEAHRNVILAKAHNARTPLSQTNTLAGGQ